MDKINTVDIATLEKTDEKLGEKELTDGFSELYSYEKEQI
jgi:hypothetical protein